MTIHPMPTPKPKKSGPLSPKAPNLDHLNRLMEAHNWGHPELAEALKVSVGVVSGWFYNRSKQAPGWTLVAVEGLERMRRRKDTQPTLLICRIPSGKETTIKDILSALGAENIHTETF